MGNTRTPAGGKTPWGKVTRASFWVSGGKGHLGICLGWANFQPGKRPRGKLEEEYFYSGLCQSIYLDMYYARYLFIYYTRYFIIYYTRYLIIYYTKYLIIPL